VKTYEKGGRGPKKTTKMKVKSASKPKGGRKKRFQDQARHFKILGQLGGWGGGGGREGVRHSITHKRGS